MRLGPPEGDWVPCFPLVHGWLCAMFHGWLGAMEDSFLLKFCLPKIGCMLIYYTSCVLSYHNRVHVDTLQLWSITYLWFPSMWCQVGSRQHTALLWEDDTIPGEVKGHINKIFWIIMRSLYDIIITLCIRVLPWWPMLSPIETSWALCNHGNHQGEDTPLSTWVYRAPEP